MVCFAFCVTLLSAMARCGVESSASLVRIFFYDEHAHSLSSSCQNHVLIFLITKLFNPNHPPDELDPEPFIRALRPLFWRHSKHHVQDELGLPPQHMVELPLSFSSVEQVNYNRQLQEARGMSLVCFCYLMNHFV
jgi:hypothetical protein